MNINNYYQAMDQPTNQPTNQPNLSVCTVTASIKTHNCCESVRLYCCTSSSQLLRCSQRKPITDPYWPALCKSRADPSVQPAQP